MGSFKDIIDGEKPVLIDFFAEWCGPCKSMPPILNEVKSRFGDTLSVIKIDVDKNPQLAAKFQIRGVPTLMLFNEGKVLWRESGVIPASQLEEIIKQHT